MNQKMFTLFTKWRSRGKSIPSLAKKSTRILRFVLLLCIGLYGQNLFAQCASCTGVVNGVFVCESQIPAAANLIDLSACDPDATLSFVDINDNGGSGYFGDPRIFTREYTVIDPDDLGDPGDNVETIICSHDLYVESTILWISNPPDVTVTLGSGECGAQVFFDAPIAGGACGTGFINQTDGTGLISGDFFLEGVTTLTYESNSSNSGFVGAPSYPASVPTQEVVITVLGNPLASNQMACNTSNVSVDENCEYLVTPANTLVGNNYGCLDAFTASVHYNINGAPGAEIPGSPLITGDFLDQVLIVMITNPSGNSCWNTKLVEDKLGPEIMNCDTVNLDCGASTDPSAANTPSSMDNCEGSITPTYTDLISGTNCADSIFQVITRTWTATDSKGNTASCEQTLNIIRPTFADITCPFSYDGQTGNQAALVCNSGFPTDANGHPSPTQTGEPTFNGNSINGICMFNVVYEDLVIPDVSCPSNFTYLRNWTVLDMCNSDTMTCSQVIKVVDTQGPAIVCPSNFTIPVGNTCAAATVLPTPVSITDACSNSNNTYTASLAGGGVLSQLANGNYVVTNLSVNTTATITYTPFDECGNVGSSCSFTVTAEDQEAPVAVCKIPVVGLNGGNSTVLAASFNDVSTDNCGIVSYEVRRVTDCTGTGTAFGPSVTFGCCDADQVVTVELRVTDTEGLTNICSVDVPVQNNIVPVITCPAGSPVAASCEDDFSSYAGVGSTDTGIEAFLEATDGTQTSIGYYDASLVSMGCFAKVVITETNTVNECGTGTITRVYRAENAAGNSTNCTYVYNVTNPTPFNGNTDVAWPTNTVVNVTAACVANTTPSATGEPVITRVLGCDKTASGYSDQIVYIDNPVQGTACYKVMRTWTVSDWCPMGSTTNFTDLQTIEVVNTTAPTMNCSAATSVNAGNSFTVSATATTCDPTGTLGAATIYYQVANANDNVFGTPVAASSFTSSTGATTNFPVGSYIVRFTATDPCNNVSTCDVDVTVSGQYDCITDLLPGPIYVNVGAGSTMVEPDDFFNAAGAPAGTTVTVANQTVLNCSDIPNNVPVNYTATITLPDGTNCTRTITLVDATTPTTSFNSVVTLTATGTVTLADWQSTLIESLDDNCTGASNVNVTYAPSTIVCNGASPVTQTVIITVSDDFNHDPASPYTDGNPTDYAVEVTVSCSTPPGAMSNVSGAISNEENAMLENVTVTPATGVDVVLTDINGAFDFDLPTSENYDITPEKNDDFLNGVSTYDIVLISKHILQTQLLDSPYKLIAADINKSGGITTLDMVELRKLILFINEEFPDNNSWRFVDANHVFDDAANPFGDVFPESYPINGLTGDMEDLDFVAVKIGDVNCSAVTNGFAGDAEDRNYNGKLDLEINDAKLKTGQTQTFDVKAKDFNNMLGYQFAMALEGLEVIEVTPGELPSLTAANFGMQRLNEGVITTSWNNTDAVSLSDGAVLFSVTVKATADVNLSEALHASSRYIAAEAYNEKGNEIELLEVNFMFRDDNGLTVANAFELFQNRPNPFKDETVIGFNLPNAGNATISVYDISGSLLKKVEAAYAKGYNEVSINRSELSATGVLYYELSTEANTAVRKMTIIN